MAELQDLILTLCDHPSRFTLVKLIFDRVSDDRCVNLVTSLLHLKSCHAELKLLHDSFDHLYWKGRYDRLRQTCYIYDHLPQPKVFGLLTYCQLIVQRREILEKRAPSVEIVESCPNFADHAQMTLTLIEVGSHYCLKTGEQGCRSGWPLSQHDLIYPD